ncbi:hypothetical protein ACSBR2_011043 [Camellia fascicularis]
MDESLEIVEKSLANSGVSIPQGVSSIKDLTSDTLFSICAQSLRLIDPSSSFPTSLPDSMADRFKICTDLASSVTNLGFIGDISFHKFLYPSEEDLYKLVRFLVRKLSELPKEVGEVSEKRDIIASTTTKENDFKAVPSEELTKKADNRRVDLSGDGVRTRLEDLRLNSEDAFVSGFLETHPLQQKIDTEAIPEISRSSMQDSSKEDTTSVQDDNESTKRVGKSYEESASQMDDKHVSEIEQKLISLSKQSSEIRYKIGKLRGQEKVLVEEASAKTVEAQHQEEEHELLKSVVEMAFDDQHNADFHITQLNEQVDSRRGHLLELETQWDTLRKSLEEKKRSLKEAIYATKPESLEKLNKLKDIELEIEAVLSETKKRDGERSKLSADLENQPKLASRRSYIQRITEIAKNIRKQDADIERILKDTRELQLEYNSIQERLHRTYAVVYETVLREAKKGTVGRRALVLLTGIHESFDQIADKLLSADQMRREVGEYEAKLSALARRSFNVDKLQADLDAIRRENEFLERQTPQ